MSSFWSSFCCFPRKRTRQDDAESETNSLLAHSIRTPSALNKPQSIVSYDNPTASSPAPGYGTVGQGHAVLGEESRLKVQNIANAVENRMISTHYPSQSNVTPHYSQPRRPTPLHQQQRATSEASDSRSPSPTRTRAQNDDAQKPSISTHDFDQSQPTINAPVDTHASMSTRPDQNRSRSSTSSSISHAHSGNVSVHDGVRRVNLNLGGMWERERGRARGSKDRSASMGSGVLKSVTGGSVQGSLHENTKELNEVVPVELPTQKIVPAEAPKVEETAAAPVQSPTETPAAEQAETINGADSNNGKNGRGKKKKGRGRGRGRGKGGK